MSKSRILDTARKYALQNAIQFNGKANPKAVAGKLNAIFKDEKISPKEIYQISGSACFEVNKIPLDQQIALLKKIAPKLLIKKKQERDFSLPSLPHAEQGKVITRFPPEPNGYLHIGHAKAAIIDYEYAQMYDGKFILRFDDTNPENAHLEFYDAQKKDLQWLGIDWDEEYNTSDHLPTHYELAEQLINQGNAYICICTSEKIKEGRYKGKSCNCKQQQPGENLDLWKNLLSTGEDNAVLRLHGVINSPNTAMRDPTLFRIIKSEHPLTGAKYHLWPTYDFAGAVEDSISGVTHPFRTKEYELRDEVYFKILSYLKLRKPYLMEFSRLSIDGMPVSKRKIKPLIDQGIVTGFDDIRLPTLRGLRKRGIIQETIKQFVLTQGISKVESTVDFSVVEAHNRKIIDPETKRLFFVANPFKLTVDNAPKKTITLPFHPTEKLGSRILETNNTFYLSGEDVQNLKEENIFRLKGLYNVKLLKKNDIIHGTFESEEILTNTPKIQWTTDKYVILKIFIPKPLFIKDEYNPDSLQEITGFAESSVQNLQNGEIIQFERFGFVRLEKKHNELVGYFAHK